VLSVGTVERHITNLYAKIGARGKADATAYAFRYGLTRAFPSRTDVTHARLPGYLPALTLTRPNLRCETLWQTGGAPVCLPESGLGISIGRAKREECPLR
jgi:hypothetical protein